MFEQLQALLVNKFDYDKEKILNFMCEELRKKNIII